MGDYTNPTSVRALFPKLDTVTALTDTQIDFYVQQAESELNARLARRFTLPFSSSPPLIGMLATEFTLIKILDRFMTAEKASKNDWRMVRKADLMETLDGIVGGQIPLLTNSMVQIGTRVDAAGISSNTSGYAPTFNLLDESLQQVDADRLDDEEDALD